MIYLLIKPGADFAERRVTLIEAVGYYKLKVYKRVMKEM